MARVWTLFALFFADFQAVGSNSFSVAAAIGGTSTAHRGADLWGEMRHCEPLAAAISNLQRADSTIEIASAAIASARPPVES